MLFRMLGVPEVYDERLRRGIRLTSSKQGTVLGALMARTGTPVPVDELIHEVWGDHPPAKAGNALQAHVSRLRQTLSLAEPETGNQSRLLTKRSGYVLRAHERETDSGQFRLSVARARRLADREPHATYHQLRQTLALWRGEVLEGSVRGPICAGMAAELERVRQDALEALFDLALRVGRHEHVLGELREAVRAHPERPRFRTQLARALTRSGLTAEPPSGTTAGLVAPSAPADGGRPSPRARTQSPAEAGRADELAQLRGLVQLLASEQRSLRARLERLTELVGSGGAGAT